MSNKILKPFQYIIALVQGHLTVLKHVFKKPVTLEYPEKKMELNDNFRGVHAFVSDEEGKLLCTACGACERACPSFGTIKIEKEKNESGKFYPKSYTLDLNKCIFCGNCVEYCPFGAIIMTKKYELADEKNSSLILDINALKANYSESIMETAKTNNKEKND
jgi:NADH-quinone oxidoreductase subunit I